MSLLVRQPDREATAGIFRCRTRIVLLASSGHVLGDPGIEGAVSTAENVDEPVEVNWNTILIWHRDKIAVTVE